MKGWIPIVVAAVIWAMVHHARSTAAAGESFHSRDGTEDTSIQPNGTSLQNSDSPRSFRSKDRPAPPRITIEETASLLQTTIIPEIDWKSMTFREGIRKLGELTTKAEIPPDRLNFVFIPRTALEGETLDKMSIEDLKIKNQSLAMVLKYMVGTTKLRYQLAPGRVEFSFMGIEITRGGNFAPPDEKDESQPGSFDPDDPFSEPVPPASR